MFRRVNIAILTSVASVASLGSVVSVGSHAIASEPTVFDERLQLSLIAEHPQIVTPVGCTYDSKGRLLVIESHTHFPPEDYAGPKYDRIRILHDRNGDGRADEFSSFYEGTTHTMSLRAFEDWVFVATRKEIFRLQDSDGDGKAETRENLIKLVTEGNYPHNGLGGLAFDQDGQLLFGLGENLGESYSVVGTDGVELKGGGEGGNVYTCELNGEGLRRVATGFWNPFGICVDPIGRVFTVGNDPDARPPCRLVHVVEAGDYGYQFRFGRSGMHPLQAWNGELPGTLPMVAGTGEAPSAVVPYHGKLWVTSWGDYRIERYQLIPQGASFAATREIVVQGDDHFRPVDFAVAPDGSLVFTDWVNKSYPVHGEGRVWRLAWKDKPPTSEFPTSEFPTSDFSTSEFPTITDGEVAAALAKVKLNLSNLDSDDPFLQTATIARLAKDRSYESPKGRRIQSSQQHLGILAAARWNKVTEPLRSELITGALADHDTDLRLYAVRWIAEEKLTTFRPALEKLTKTNRTSLPLFQATVAAIEWLDKGNTGNATRADYLKPVLANPDSYSPDFLVQTLRAMPADGLTLENLQQLLRHPDRHVQRAAVRSLVLSDLPERDQTLRQIANSKRFHAEARRDAQIRTVNAGEDHSPHERPDRAVYPAAADTTAWERLLTASKGNPSEEISTQGDPDRGWRVFFGANAARCANCHTYQGRGAAVGPDLSEVTKRLDRRRLIESILQPSREVAPRFVVTQVATSDGRSHSGMSLGVFKEGEEEFVSPDGKTFTLNVSDIESRKFSTQSVMPDGLEKTMSLQDLRDLLALLEAK